MNGTPPPIVPVILCGGSGTRLWPRSRAAKPKPFLPLLGQQTLFAATLARCPLEAGFGEPIVVTGAGHLGDVVEQLAAGAVAASIIVEPVQRNTAAAIALAAARLPAETVMLVCPSDHHIADTSVFRDRAQAAAALAREGWLVAIGIEPTAPEPGFGYIEVGEPVGEGFRVRRFVEKPSREQAAQLLAAGGHLWNGGIFAFAAGTYLAELELHRPQIVASTMKAVASGREEARCFHPEAAAFAAIVGESVDYAVMENTERAAVVPAEMRWSDIGNWQALHQALERDGDGNAVQGRAELVACRNVLVSSDGPRVSVIGADDLVVVVDGDEVLVTTTASAHLVGKLAGAVAQ